MGGIKCNKCGALFGCKCSMININGYYYCKTCAIQIYKNKLQPNNSFKQNEHLYVVKAIVNKK